MLDYKTVKREHGLVAAEENKKYGSRALSTFLRHEGGKSEVVKYLKEIGCYFVLSVDDLDSAPDDQGRNIEAVRRRLETEEAILQQRVSVSEVRRAYGDYGSACYIDSKCAGGAWHISSLRDALGGKILGARKNDKPVLITVGVDGWKPILRFPKSS
jgi:hypothetical protein